MRTTRIGLLLALGMALAGCKSDKRSAQLADGGAFVVPDSGYIFDGGSGGAVARDGGVADTGPAVCNPTCADRMVCACLHARNGANCGCHVPQSYGNACDPQVSDSCKWPFDCVRARTSVGTTYICSDGREGTPCSLMEESCNTARGCGCFSTPFGTSCTCQGESGPSELLCNPTMPESCVDGTCVRVEGQAGTFFLCSDGSEHQPCEVGDMSCTTSLGCTCPLVGGRQVCRCSEPGEFPGDACDPMVRDACVAPLRCEVRGNPVKDGFFSECNGGSGQGGPDPDDPFGCDPQLPMCPQGFRCVETSEGRYSCRP